MKEIKFRGKRIENGEWVYGYLVKREPTGSQKEEGHDIVVPVGNTSSVTYSIKKGSEGQYTGLTDSKGIETKPTRRYAMALYIQKGTKN